MTKRIMEIIKSRTSGLKYRTFCNSFKLKSHPQWPFSDDGLKELMMKQLYGHRLCYFFGYNISRPYGKRFESIRHEIYRYLHDSYSENTGQFNFNGIIVPIPEHENEIGAFVAEVTDMLLHELTDDAEFRHIVYYEGPYEMGNVQINENDIVFDCGAHMGLFSAMASRKGAEVYAFEPFDYVVENYLSKTVEWNPGIQIFKYAISDKEEQISFIQKADTFFNSHVATAERGAKDTDKIVTVQAIPLDVFVERNNIGRVDFIKADIEGAERYLLKGAKNVLKEFAPKISICTYHLPDDPKVLRELILDANPNYIIEEYYSKMYAYVAGK